MHRLLAVTLLITGLSGCTSGPTPSKVAPNGKYIGWYCEGDISSDEHWRCDKKTLKEGLLVTTATAVEAVVESASEPASPVASETTPVAATPGPTADAVDPEPRSSALEVQDSTDPTSGYTIQLGAFDSPEQAQTVVAGLGVEGDIKIREILSRGTTFSVILMGHYFSRSQANAVAETLGINYWVRSMRSLADAAAQ